MIKLTGFSSPSSSSTSWEIVSVVRPEISTHHLTNDIDIEIVVNLPVSLAVIVELIVVTVLAI